MKKQLAICLSLMAFACFPAAGSGNKPVQDSLYKWQFTLDTGNLPEYITADSASMLPEPPVLEKEFLYDKYTLEDKYAYGDGERMFQWEKIAWKIYDLERLHKDVERWGVMQNRRNVNGRPPLTKYYEINEYKIPADRYGVEQSEGIPLYALNDTLRPERYGLDGSLVKLLDDTTSFYKVRVADFIGEWLVPKKYIVSIGAINFNRLIFIDRTNQNIATVEKGDGKWLVRSMNPATTGLRKPPYQMETPLGVFVIQQKLRKMIFNKDGTNIVGGFAPWASRFSNGGYVHGVPVNLPSTQEVEYSRTLGTTPRSHMCVRNATSHAKYVYDWALIFESLVFVIE